MSALIGDERAFQLPSTVSRRLYSKLERHLAAQESGPQATTHEIPVGITDDTVPLGAHLILGKTTLTSTAAFASSIPVWARESTASFLDMTRPCKK